MPDYRLYFIEPRPKHIREIVDFAALDDVDALHCASTRAAGRTWELWRDESLVGVYTEPARAAG